MPAEVKENPVKNRQKPIVGLLAGVIIYVAAKFGLDLDADLAAAIAGVIGAVAVERVRPIFGEKVDTPKVVEIEGRR